MTKAELRKKIRLIQNELSEDYIKKSSSLITDKLLRSEEYINASSVFIYISSPSEPSTKEIISHAFSAGKRVFVPYCIKKGEMKAVRLFPDSVLVDGIMGTKEPEAKHYENLSPDLTIVPCMSASPDGRRLGHGGGFYDIFLEENKTCTVCLCFEALLSEDIPLQSHDILMDKIITEKSIYIG